MLDKARGAAVSLLRLKVLLPGLLWLVFVVVFAAVGAAANTRSLLLTLALPTAVVATLTVWVTLVSVTQRFARRSPKLDRHAPWGPRQWADFEHALWSYVEGSSDTPPRAAE